MQGEPDLTGWPFGIGPLVGAPEKETQLPLTADASLGLT